METPWMTFSEDLCHANDAMQGYSHISKLWGVQLSIPSYPYKRPTTSVKRRRGESNGEGIPSPAD